MSTSSTPPGEKAAEAHSENGPTKDEESYVGLSLENTLTNRTKNEVNFSFVMTMVGFTLTFAVAEITPLFLVTVFTVIAIDINALHSVIWILVSQLIATAAIAPFVGTLSDIFGRKKITLGSLALTVVGMIVFGTSNSLAPLIVGQVLLGLAIGIQLLTTVAAVTELVPTSQRGITIGYVVAGLIPFAPASLYGQYIATHSWRYITILLGGCAIIAFVLLLIFYNPPPRENSRGLTKRQMIERVDFLGAFLSIVGLVLFLMGINWGGQDYPWSSAHVISTLTLGLVFLSAFFLWEKFGARYPMFPMRLAQNKRIFTAVCILCLTSGINYVPVVIFWVLQCYTVYGASLQQAGVYLLPIGFCIIGGAVISAGLVSAIPTKIHVLLIVFCIAQTAGLGSMAAIDPENLSTAWAPLIIGLIGVGGVMLPSQLIFSIITPNDIIGTDVALSIVIRLIGEVVGICLFYNVFLRDVTKYATMYFAIPAINAGFTTVDGITELVTTLTAGPLTRNAYLFPQLDTPEKIASIVMAGHETFKHCFPILYLIAIAFGGAAIIACTFLIGLEQFINEDVAVFL